jgi:hypothetical protein
MEQLSQYQHRPEELRGERLTVVEFEELALGMDRVDNERYAYAQHLLELVYRPAVRIEDFLSETGGF